MTRSGQGYGRPAGLVSAAAGRAVAGAMAGAAGGSMAGTVTGGGGAMGGAMGGAVARTARKGAHGVVAVVAAGVGLLGVAGASWAGLMRQARTATSVIEAAAMAADLKHAQGTPHGIRRGFAHGAPLEGAESAWQAVAPCGDGIYLADGSGPLVAVPEMPPGPARVVGGPESMTAPSAVTTHPATEVTANPANPVNPANPPVRAVTAVTAVTAHPPDPRPGRPLVLSMLGDSTAVGYGCASADEVPGVVLARAVAAAAGRPVRVVTHGVVGTGASDLARQVASVLPDRPDVAVIVVGANDVRARVSPRRAAMQLGQAVAALGAQGVPVVVGSCPDLGVIAPIPQPLRSVVGLWSRALARLQERAVAAAGGVAVPIARLVSPEFYGRPDLFFADGFHPSGPGYARAVAALLPQVLAALP